MADGERIYYEQLDPLSDLRSGHSARYFMARGYLRPFDRVLDAACGAGGGTQILVGAERVHVTGYDYDEKAIAHARKTYTSPEITFLQQDLDEWQPLKDQCDVAVSFETIEHLKNDPKIFAEKLKTAAGRMIICSAPIVPTVGINHHHRHDLTDEQMVAMFQDSEWVLYEKFKQRVYGVYVFARKSEAKSIV